MKGTKTNSIQLKQNKLKHRKNVKEFIQRVSPKDRSHLPWLCLLLPQMPKHASFHRPNVIFQTYQTLHKNWLLLDALE